MIRLPVSLMIVICLFCLLALAQNAPSFIVDPFWPKELPNNWILGQIRGVAIDNNDHIWVLNEGVPRDNASLAKTPPEAQCCIPAPLIIEFDSDGKVLRTWGGPRYVPAWPTSPHGISVDRRETSGLVESGVPGTLSPDGCSQRRRSYGTVKCSSFRAMASCSCKLAVRPMRR